MNMDIIKAASSEAIKATNPSTILFGTVISVDPVEIKVGDTMVLHKGEFFTDSPIQKDESVILMGVKNSKKYLVLSTLVSQTTNVTYVNGGVTGNWVTCVASAYSDIGRPVALAGEPVMTWNTMSVAVPMGAVYRANKGRWMQVKYGDKIALAKVTDCGNFGAGNKYTNRQLDLAPGVWRKTFGVKSEYAWGLRTVQYRYV